MDDPVSEAIDSYRARKRIERMFRVALVLGGSALGAILMLRIASG